jgi:hypothetical protein
LVLLASEKYLSINNHQALNNLAVALSNQALSEACVERNRLFKLAYSNFKAAALCNSVVEDSFTIYYRWANALCDQAKASKISDDALGFLEVKWLS